MSNYKKGDLVQVKDDSCALAVEKYFIRMAYNTEWNRELNDRDFIVIDVIEKDDRMIIKAKDNDQIIIIEERMIKPIVEKEESITYNLTFIINEEADITKIMKELERKLKMVSIKL